MTKIYVEENEIEDAKIIVSSTFPTTELIAKNIKKPSRNFDEIIKVKSTEDPFKFISQEKQGKDYANSNEKRIVENKLKPEFKMYRQGDILYKKLPLSQLA